MLCEGKGKHCEFSEESTQIHTSERSADPAPLSRIHLEQLQILKSQGRADFITLLLFTSAMSVGLVSHADHRWLLAWCFALLLNGLIKLYAHPVETPNLQGSRVTAWLPWARSGWLGSVFTGSLWGSVIGLFPSSDTLQVVFLVSLLLGYLVLGAGLRASSLPVLHGFVGAAMFASLCMLLYRHDAPLDLFLPIVLLAGSGLIILGHFHNHVLTRQIRLRLHADAQADAYAIGRDQAHIEMLNKNQFLAAASHDLRQSVHAIGLFAGLLEMQLKQQDTKGVLGKIQLSIRALSALFDGILDISRLDANAVEHEPQHVELDPLLRRLKSEYDLLACEKGLSLRVDTTSGCIANVDPTLLQRVLMNLVSNAIKFTEQGSIIISIEPIGDRLSIRVTDTGRGIACDQMENIFVEYQQILNTDHVSDVGHGLGLAIVKRLCDLMSIPIGVTSTLGVGTEFSLLIVKGDPDNLLYNDVLTCDEALVCKTPRIDTPEVSERRPAVA